MVRFGYLQPKSSPLSDVSIKRTKVLHACVKLSIPFSTPSEHVLVIMSMKVTCNLLLQLYLTPLYMTFVQGKYKVYNLCSERLYDASLFEGKVGDGTSLDLCPLGWYYCGLQVSRKLSETIGIGVWFLSLQF